MVRAPWPCVFVYRCVRLLCVCVRVCQPTMWFHFLTEQKGCVSFIICPLRAVSLSPFFAASYATLLLFHLFCPFLKSHLGRGAEKKWRQRESESSCRAGEIVLIKETAAPCERSLVGQRLNRLLQKGTCLWCCCNSRTQ